MHINIVLICTLSDFLTFYRQRYWEDDIKMNQEVGWGGMDWIGVADSRDWWRALLNAVMNLWVP